MKQLTLPFETDFSYRWENPETQRYYRAIISRDMFGTWVVSKIWGGIGNASGRMVHLPCPTLDDALAMILQISKIRKKRGYEIV